MDDKTLTLLSRKEEWRQAHQTIVQLGNKIAVNNKIAKDIQARLYEWSDEALARSRECQAIMDLFKDNTGEKDE